MAVNEKLEKVVLEAMVDFLNERDPSFNSMCDGEKELGLSLLTEFSMAKTMVDEISKVRIHVNNIIIYGYDFNQEHDEEPAKEVYERAVKNTKEFSGHPNMESFVSSGIVKNRFGWYITHI
ncbi:hypothetical protein HYW74_01485 [Candidatus Pacearchaeota archaeon]|nr:hypothetical protein [Candidatus Pacearchaeota archaeon]